MDFRRTFAEHLKSRGKAEGDDILGRIETELKDFMLEDKDEEKK